MKQSPSFIERRKRLFSNKNSTAASDCSGAQSMQQLSTGVGGGGAGSRPTLNMSATFSSEMFRGSAGQ